MKTKLYINLETEERTRSATIAKQWHENGQNIGINTLNEKGALINCVCIDGAKVETHQEKTDRENWEQCKSVSDELEYFIDGNYHHCPECGETVYIPDTVGDKFKCTYCRTVSDVSEFEQLGLYDYMEDALDFDFLVNSRKEFSAVKILVAYGGPSIYINTISGAIELYWWTDSAKYFMRSDVIDAVNDWAEEYFNMI